MPHENDEQEETSDSTAGKLHVAAECVVCLDSPPRMQLLPCNHVCLCKECSPLIVNECPLCRTSIVGRRPPPMKELIETTPASWEDLVGDGFIRLCLCSNVFVRQVLLLYQVAEAYTQVLVIVQVLIAYVPMYLGLKKGMTSHPTPEEARLSNCAWWVAALITWGRFFWLPQIKTFQIRHKHPLVCTEFHVQYQGGRVAMVTWRSIADLAKRIIFAYSTSKVVDCIWPTYSFIYFWMNNDVRLISLLPSLPRTWWNSEFEVPAWALEACAG